MHQVQSGTLYSAHRACCKTSFNSILCVECNQCIKCSLVPFTVLTEPVVRLLLVPFTVLTEPVVRLLVLLFHRGTGCQFDY